jgi:lysozyme
MRDLKKAIDIIKKWEGFRGQAYKDPVGIWTIGYGTIRYSNGVAVKQGDTVSEENASIYLTKHVEEKILGQLDSCLQVEVNDNQYCALVSFAYNLGIGALQKSTLLKKLNAKDYFGAANEFDKWVYAGGQKLKGLVNRRAEEKALFKLATVEVEPEPGEPPQVDTDTDTILARIPKAINYILTGSLA